MKNIIVLAICCLAIAQLLKVDIEKANKTATGTYQGVLASICLNEDISCQSAEQSFLEYSRSSKYKDVILCVDIDKSSSMNVLRDEYRIYDNRSIILFANGTKFYYYGDIFTEDLDGFIEKSLTSYTLRITDFNSSIIQGSKAIVRIGEDIMGTFEQLSQHMPTTKFILAKNEFKYKDTQFYRNDTLIFDEKGDFSLYGNQIDQISFGLYLTKAFLNPVNKFDEHVQMYLGINHNDSIVIVYDRLSHIKEKEQFDLAALQNKYPYMLYIDACEEYKRTKMLVELMRMENYPTPFIAIAHFKNSGFIGCYPLKGTLNKDLILSHVDQYYHNQLAERIVSEPIPVPDGSALQKIVALNFEEKLNQCNGIVAVLFIPDRCHNCEEMIPMAENVASSNKDICFYKVDLSLNDIDGVVISKYSRIFLFNKGKKVGEYITPMDARTFEDYVSRVTKRVNNNIEPPQLHNFKRDL